MFQIGYIPDNAYLKFGNGAVQSTHKELRDGCRL